MLSALRLSQQAPAILGHGPASNTPVASAKTSRDTAEEYSRIEQLFLACLQTGDDQSAQTCLDRLSHRFGPSNERVMGLRGLFQEATAKDQPALEKCLAEYETILSENPVNVVRCSPLPFWLPSGRVGSRSIFFELTHLHSCSAYHETPSRSASLASAALRGHFRSHPASRCHPHRCGGLGRAG